MVKPTPPPASRDADIAIAKQKKAEQEKKLEQEQIKLKKQAEQKDKEKALEQQRQREKEKLAQAQRDEEAGANDDPAFTFGGVEGRRAHGGSARSRVEERAHVGVGRGLHLGDRALGDDLPLGQHGHSIGHAERAVHVVGDDDLRAAEVLLHANDQLVDDAGRDGIEAGRRLVVEDDLGLHRDGAREAHALAHASRQIRRPHVLDARQVHPREVLRDALRQLRG